MPPDQPDASSADTSDVGSRNTIAGTTYRNTHASPYTAIDGADRRLATELVVIIASAIHVMYCCRDPVGSTRPGLGVPAVSRLIGSPFRRAGRDMPWHATAQASSPHYPRPGRAAQHP